MKSAANRFVVAIAALSVAAVLSVIVTPVGAGAAAAVQVDCADGPDWIVATAAEIDAAIGCHNAGLLASTITLSNDITGLTRGFTPVRPHDPAATLVIDGAGYTIEGQPVRDIDEFIATDPDLLPEVFSVRGAASVTLSNVSVRGVYSALGVGRSGDVTLVNANISFAYEAVSTNDGQVTVVDSQIDNAIVGVDVRDGTAFVQRSDVRGFEPVVVWGGAATLDGVNLVSSVTALRTADATISISNSTLQASGAQGIGVFAREGNVSIVSSTVEGGAFAVLLFGADTVIGHSVITSDESALLVGEGQLAVSDSTVNAGTSGVYISGALASITRSTIQGSGRVGVRVDEGAFALVSNSTVSGPDVGVSARERDTRVVLANSTITSAGESVVAESDSVVSVTSSVLSRGCNVHTRGQGNYVASGESCGASLALVGALGPIADNGCSRATPLGCPRTHALAADSNALDGGVCREVPLFIAGGQIDGSLTIDQRGEPRNPASCDAGSYEQPVVDGAQPGPGEPDPVPDPVLPTDPAPQPEAEPLTDPGPGPQHPLGFGLNPVAS